MHPIADPVNITGRDDDDLLKEDTDGSDPQLS